MNLTITNNNDVLTLTYDSGRVIDLMLSNIIWVDSRGNNVFIINEYNEPVAHKGIYGSNTIKIDYRDVTSPVYNSVGELLADIRAMYVNARSNTSSSLWSRYTAPTTLVTAQPLTSVYADFGDEIDMRGYKALIIALLANVNDSEDVILKGLGKLESGAVNEFDLEGTPSKTLWSTSASLVFNKMFFFATNGIPFILLQAMAGTVGVTPGNLTIKIIKLY
ncbi:MAG: hypothetical protein H8E98_04885 [Bacteroidetes bacterium]|nr:hypothetical protein [Bacteroidota bacterium]